MTEHKGGVINIVSLKDFWANALAVKALRDNQPHARAAVSADELKQAYERIQDAIADDELLLKDLNKLKASAESGTRLSWWSRRFVFGFGVAKAIEEWFFAFDSANPDKPLVERIPRNETSNVAAKWLWYGVFTSVLSVILSLLVAGITAFYLIKQTGVLTRQTDVLTRQETNTRETNINVQRTQYTQILYDVECESTPVNTESAPSAGQADVEEFCTPIYNFRIRSEAAKALLALDRVKIEVLAGQVSIGHGLAVAAEPEFSQARLDDTDLFAIDFSNTNLHEANLKNAKLLFANLFEANLMGANLTGANLSNADLTDAILKNAKLNGAVLFSANLTNANFENANLTGADLRGARLIDANLFGANLGGAILNGAKVTQSQIDTACGNEKTEIPDGLTIQLCISK